ncbi:hypothetical protein SVIOM342S_07856 [Streptomyces violaceorubidus]
MVTPYAEVVAVVRVHRSTPPRTGERIRRQTAPGPGETRVAFAQGVHRALGLEPGERPEERGVRAGQRHLPLGQGTGDVELVRGEEHLGVPVGRADVDDHLGTGGDVLAGEREVLGGDPALQPEPRRVAQCLLHR